MLDQGEFDHLQRYFEEEDEAREHIIKQARDILKASKHAIYCLHRDDIHSATGSLQHARHHTHALLPLVKQRPHLRSGIYGQALEEYVEAMALLIFLTEKRIVQCRELEFVTPEEYLAGLCDFTGELGRHAVHAATKKDRSTVQLVRDAMDDLFGRLVGFDFRNNELRRKYDSVKYNLKKVEDLLCELSMKSA